MTNVVKMMEGFISKAMEDERNQEDVGQDQDRVLVKNNFLNFWKLNQQEAIGSPARTRIRKSQQKEEFELKMRFLQCLQEINVLSADVAKDMKMSLKKDVIQIRKDLEKRKINGEKIPAELQNELYEEIFPELQVDEDEEALGWMKRSYKIMKYFHAEREQVKTIR